MSNKNSWYSIQAVSADGDTPPSAAISISGVIGSDEVNSDKFASDLDALGDVSEIKLAIHSPGGDVMDGTRIYNKLVEHPAKVRARVEGLAASMGSVILMAADEIEMPENTFLMIHNPHCIAAGDAKEMLNTAQTLESVQESIVSAYEKRTGLPREEIQSMMDREAWIPAAEAKEKGFADTVTDSYKIAALAEDWKGILPNTLPNGLVFGTPKPEAKTKPEPKPTPKNHTPT
ncbi:MAG TPA: peptidase S14, partial [Gammaproteobacteria bacterium]|nr:peptidase S14 [Gammaproteobacteria bacterium]